jgi:hypothetical protein
VPTRSAPTGRIAGGRCLSPLDFGAIANDGLDDREAVQQTLEAACTRRRDVCLPAGDLHIGRRYGTGAANAWSLALTCDGVTIVGEGDTSRLVMLGSAKVGAMTGAGDWWLLKLSGSNHTLRNFAIDGAARSLPTSEQTHLIKILGPATGMTLEGLQLNLPDLGANSGGDCIQAGGEERTPVRGITIDRVRGEACDRSFIGLQRWVSQVRVTNSSSNQVGDQVFDEEPTGVGTIGDVSIKSCRFRRNGRADGVAVTITGGAGGARPGYDHTIESTQIDGGVLIYNSARVTLRDLSIVSSGVAPTIDIRKRSSDVVIERVYAEHSGGVPAAVVFLGLHGTSWPTNATIRASHLVQKGPGDVIRGEPVVGLTVEDNRLDCLGPTADTFSAIALRAVNADVDGVTVRNNIVSGNCRYLVRASATPRFNIAATRTLENKFEGGTTGVYFENGPPTARPVVHGNTFDRLAPSTHVIGAGAAGFDGSNREASP